MDEAFRLGDRVAVMSQGRLLQHDRPAVLITQPADPFVSQLIGSGDRSLKLLSLTTAGEVVEPGSVAGPHGAVVGDARATCWPNSSGAERQLRRSSGPTATPIGHVTLARILARGTAGNMSRSALAARLAVLGLLLAFLVAPQAFAPVCSRR